MCSEKKTNQKDHHLSIGKVEKGPSTGIVPHISLFETSLQKKLKITISSHEVERERDNRAIVSKLKHTKS